MDIYNWMNRPDKMSKLAKNFTIDLQLVHVDIQKKCWQENLFLAKKELEEFCVSYCVFPIPSKHVTYKYLWHNI